MAGRAGIRSDKEKARGGAKRGSEGGVAVKRAYRLRATARGLDNTVISELEKKDRWIVPAKAALNPAKTAQSALKRVRCGAF
jgi:hypothetical protein